MPKPSAREFFLLELPTRLQELETEDPEEFKRFLSVYLRIERAHNPKMRGNLPAFDLAQFRHRRAAARKTNGAISRQRLGDAWDIYIVEKLIS